MELYLPEPPKLTRNPVNGRILPGHTAPNKGKKWDEYNVPIESRETMLSNLVDWGRRKGARMNKKKNSIPVVGIKDGKWFGGFLSAGDAEEKLRKIGITVYAENIRNCCNGKRQRAGGIHWFYENDFERWNGEIM